MGAVDARSVMLVVVTNPKTPEVRDVVKLKKEFYVGQWKPPNN